jgi:GDPmannose 4,6-dehydratase
MKTALITGITGQDGSYMAELLLSKGYKVHGIIRRASTFNTQRIDHIYADRHKNPDLILHYGDMTDSGAISDVVHKTQPDEIYNFAAQSHVRVSFDLPEYTGDVTGIATVRMLDAIRRMDKPAKFFQASTSELYGGAVPPQNEKTNFIPRSPYASAKLFSYWTTVNYREAYNIHATNGITFNHESPRRGETFVTRKITRSISRILSGIESTIYLGYLDSYRDWGYAPEYMSIIYDIMQLDKSVDVVIGTGVSYTVRNFLDYAFDYCGVKIIWTGSGTNEKAIVDDFDSRWAKVLKKGQAVVKIDPRYYRPTEVEHLKADISYMKEILGREPKIKFHELIKIMMDSDMLKNGLTPLGEGFAIHNDLNFKWSSNLQISGLN